MEEVDEPLIDLHQSMGSFQIRKLLHDDHDEPCCIPFVVLSPPPHKKIQHISPFVIIVVGILGGCFLLVTYYAIIVKYCTNMRNSRTPQDQQTQNAQNDGNTGAHEEFLDENHGPVLDHPIWYIHTVGLPQSVIDSINIVKFRKGDGLLEDMSDCSVCLSEFEDGENLRLLPKCSHAFHVNCIDTWLRSHTNCPSCRAPIVAPGGSSSGSGSSVVEDGVENESNGGNEGSEMDVEVENEGEEQDRVNGIGVLKKNLLSESEFRVLSDLSDTHRLGLGQGQDRRPPMRRSASMDFNPASVFCFSMGNSFPEEEDEGSASVPIEKGKKDNPSPGICTLIGSSSKGKLLPKSPAFMKRSVSSGGKLLSSKSSRNQSSVLPL